MSLKTRIEERLEFEDVVVAEKVTQNMAGKDMLNYAVNKHGIVLQFAISSDETDEGVIEDFLEYIEATVADID
jgi:N-acetylglutamate synthase-like GNAT family acetyltransferase